MLKDTEKKHNALVLLFLLLVAFQLGGLPPPPGYAFDQVGS